MLKLRMLALLVGVLALSLERVGAAEQPLFIGTRALEQGIYACTLNLSTGEFTPAEAIGDAPRPTFMALHPRLPLLYAVTLESEVPSGGIRAFRMEPTNGQQPLQLTLINQQPTGDEGATHLALDPAGSKVVVVHYAGGSTSLLPLSEEGSLLPLTTKIEHKGSSVNLERQNEPHAHGVAFDDSGRFACVADLGTDEVIVYRLESDGTLERISAWKAAPGAGPRHLAFHPNGSWLYCIHELSSTMSVLSFDAQAGQLTELQTISTLPEGFQGENITAEVVVHPSGKFVYGSNRGYDSTAVYAIDAESGRLSLVEIEPTQGVHPRFIGIEPSGNFLIAANRDSDNLVSFRINLESGALTPTGHQVSVAKPVSVAFPVIQP